jgi:tRNA 2-selenouridine synthase
MLFRTANLSQLGGFDEIIDVRTPAEFADDHIPGAINCPVLSNEERIAVGTLYKQQSPFEARKVGAAMVARNIAHHLETKFSGRPKSWRPLVYCWRGGQRSGAMSIVLSQVGWAAHRLEGGYKSYRRHVIEQLESIPKNFSWRVICGPTGSGKSRLLTVMQKQGLQVLDLENLAQHRGSVLGRLPGLPQPSQKCFDSLLLSSLQRLDPAKPVYVEAESSKIGLISLPLQLTEAMHEGECLVLDVPFPVRVAGLLEDYRYYLEHPQMLIEHLEALHRFHGEKRLKRWTELIHEGDFATMVEELLKLHYDPTYSRATSRNYPNLECAKRIALSSLAEDALIEAVQGLCGSSR